MHKVKLKLTIHKVKLKLTMHTALQKFYIVSIHRVRYLEDEAPEKI